MGHGLYRHKNTGDIYKILNADVINATNSVSGQTMVLYVSLDTGRSFVREKEEFFDGRFEEYQESFKTK